MNLSKSRLAKVMTGSAMTRTALLLALCLQGCAQLPPVELEGTIGTQLNSGRYNDPLGTVRLRVITYETATVRAFFELQHTSSIPARDAYYGRNTANIGMAVRFGK